MFRSLKTPYRLALAAAAILGAWFAGVGIQCAIRPSANARSSDTGLAIAPRPIPHNAAGHQEPEPLLNMLHRVFVEEGVPPEYLWVAEVESAWDPTARSRVGAMGLYQIMPDTATRFKTGVVHPDEHLDPETNARVAARYLKRLHKRFGDWTLVLAAYNAGENRVHRLLLETGGNVYGDIVDRLPGETRAYVDMVQAIIESEQKARPDLFPQKAVDKADAIQ